MTKAEIILALGLLLSRFKEDDAIDFAYDAVETIEQILKREAELNAHHY